MSAIQRMADKARGSGKGSDPDDRIAVEIEDPENATHPCGSSHFPAIQLDAIDGQLAVHYWPGDMDALRFVPADRPLRIKAYGESITGRLARLQIEHGGPILWFQPISGEIERVAE